MLRRLCSGCRAGGGEAVCVTRELNNESMALCNADGSLSVITSYSIHYTKLYEVAAAAMNRAIERCVREAPAQYQWEYKRFNTRPEA